MSGVKRDLIAEAQAMREAIDTLRVEDSFDWVGIVWLMTSSGDTQAVVWPMHLAAKRQGNVQRGGETWFSSSPRADH